MATAPRYPTLFQINTRVWLQRLAREAGKAITLADIDDATIDGFAERGFDWIWLLSVWQIGAAGRAVSRGNPQWRAEFEAILPDLTEDDMGTEVYDRDGTELVDHGLYIDHAPWHFNVFELRMI